jgi:hypothetical protein
MPLADTLDKLQNFSSARLCKFTLEEDDLTDETIGIFLNRRLCRDILYLSCMSQLYLEHRHIHAPPKQTLQKQTQKEMRILKGI